MLCSPRGASNGTVLPATNLKVAGHEPELHNAQRLGSYATMAVSDQIDQLVLAQVLMNLLLSGQRQVL